VAKNRLKESSLIKIINEDNAHHFLQYQLEFIPQG